MLAAAGLAMYGMHVYYTGLLLPAVLTVLLHLLLLLVLAGGDQPWRSPVAGALIGLAIDVETVNDMTETMMEVMEEQAQPGMEMNLDRAEMAFALEATGELRWNLTAGHVHSMQIEGDSNTAMEMEISIDLGGQSMALEMSMEMSGSMESVLETR